jgi:hypothetical protein
MTVVVLAWVILIDTENNRFRQHPNIRSKYRQFKIFVFLAFLSAIFIQLSFRQCFKDISFYYTLKLY